MSIEDIHMSELSLKEEEKTIYTNPHVNNVFWI